MLVNNLLGGTGRKAGGSLLVWPLLILFLNVFNRLQIWDGFYSITSYAITAMQLCWDCSWAISSALGRQGPVKEPSCGL